MWHRGKFCVSLLLVQVALIALYASLVNYSPDVGADRGLQVSWDEEHDTPDLIDELYPMFQDVNVMIFFGIGFLLSYLRKFSYSALGNNFLLGAVCVQWALVVDGLFNPKEDGISIDIKSIVNSYGATATVLISFGAIHGKASSLQLLVMSVLEVALYSCNMYYVIEVFQASDLAGSMFLHAFAAYFGLAVAFVLYNKDVTGHPKEGSVYNSDVIAMIGTIFLWMFWPSFNAALAEGRLRHRAVVNTWLSMVSCCVTTFAVSSLLDQNNRISMVHVQNATLSGGVAVAAIAHMMLHPFGAMILGSVTAILCTLGYHVVTPVLSKFCRIHDTCGINNLHGIPGILGGIVSTFMAYYASEKDYGTSLYDVFPARTPKANSSLYVHLQSLRRDLDPGDGRTPGLQASYQLAALGLTLSLAIVGGLVTGVIMRIQIFDPPKSVQLYDDKDFWILPEDSSDEEKIDSACNEIELDFVKSVLKTDGASVQNQPTHL